jgi:hypothetical protein
MHRCTLNSAMRRPARKKVHAPTSSKNKQKMVNCKTNWIEYERATEGSSSTQLDPCYIDSEQLNKVTTTNSCILVHLNNLPAKLSTKIQICQLCNYELRKPI